MNNEVIKKIILIFTRMIDRLLRNAIGLKYIYGVLTRKVYLQVPVLRLESPT